MSIDQISDQLIVRLNNYEKECKNNLDKIKQTKNVLNLDLNKLKEETFNWKEMLRSPELEDENIKILKNEIELVLNERLEVLEDIKDNFLLGKEIYFKPKNTNFNLDLFADFDIRRSFVFDSKILTREQSNDLIKLCEFNDKEKFKLIYRASKDGFKSSDFHSKCDNKTNTLTIIKVKGNSNIFGGYTTCTWNHIPGSYKSDSSAFIVSLINEDSNPIKIEHNQDGYAILCYSSY